MVAPFGFVWLIWHRARVPFGFTLASALLAWAMQVTFLSPYALYLGTLSFGMSLLTLVSALTLADAADIAGLGSSYPKHLLLLPVHSRELAFWPMLFGSMLCGLAWVPFAWVELYPLFGPLAMTLPLVGLVTLLAGLQMTAWVPLPLPFLRSGLIVLVGCGLAGIGPIAVVNGVAPTIVGVGYAAFCLLAFFFSSRGLAAVRTGSNVEWRWISVNRTTSVEKPLRPFRSPMEAQVWLECKYDGIMMPLLACFLTLLYFVAFFGARRGENFTVGDFRIPFLLPLYAAPFVLMAVFSGFDGCCGSVKDNFKPDFSLINFLAVRPLSDAAIVESKLRMALRATIRSWKILSPGLLLLALGRVEIRHASTTVAALVANQASGRQIATGVLAMALLFYLTWKGTISAMWMRLTDRSWIRNGIGIVLPIAGFGGGIFVVGRLGQDPRLFRYAVEWSPRVLPILCGVKLLAAMIASRELWKRELVSPQTMLRWAAPFAVGSLAFVFTVRGLWPELRLSWLQGASSAFLLMPLVRVPLAILTLHFNRHR